MYEKTKTRNIQYIAFGIFFCLFKLIDFMYF